METEKTAILRHECTVNEREVSACETSFSFSERPIVFGGVDFVSTCVTCIVRCFLSHFTVAISIIYILPLGLRLGSSSVPQLPLKSILYAVGCITD